MNPSNHTIRIYGEISEKSGQNKHSAKHINKSLEKADGENIDIFISSPGGDIVEGIAMYEVIKNYPGKVRIFIEGVACGTASIVALAGNEIYINRKAYILLTSPKIIIFSDIKEIKQKNEILRKCYENFIDIYKKRMNKSADEIKSFLDNETWFDCDEAVNANLADYVYSGL